MEWTLWIRALSALALVALLLYGLYWAARFLSQGRLATLGRSRLVVVVESTFLAQNTSVHVVKVGARYYLVGASHGHVALISELSAAEVEGHMELQRQALSAQTARLGALFGRRRS
ncbi:MAG: flagellar biosynthetic protein FliO [Candidatus Eremiobacteraeota bacterium]|nr:flagellar biosynthetic protein FliO [Candidatus Eremiobacteraeota bacterium]MBV8602647.1 flagellar biosynthetic protein FliO [Candidatus Eremiobacteraeota bacterium]